MDFGVDTACSYEVYESEIPLLKLFFSRSRWDRMTRLTQPQISDGDNAAMDLQDRVGPPVEYGRTRPSSPKDPKPEEMAGSFPRN